MGPRRWGAPDGQPSRRFSTPMHRRVGWLICFEPCDLLRGPDPSFRARPGSRCPIIVQAAGGDPNICAERSV
ncbi:hypothetical protein [Parafrankia colletiae]|uniref:hypothetical protein n=1 Tax=Parafrankia colletiae TaxID=573497 RepID=UPI0038991163